MVIQTDRNMAKLGIRWRSGEMPVNAPEIGLGMRAVKIATTEANALELVIDGVVVGRLAL